MVQMRRCPCTRRFSRGIKTIRLRISRSAAMIKHAMELNSDYVPAGCVLIQELLWQHGREDNAEAYQRKAKEHERIVALATLERRRGAEVRYFRRDRPLRS
jgi:hypothetical protein